MHRVQIKRVAEQLKLAMNETLYGADWMDDATKAVALDKLERMNDTITKEDVEYLYDQAQLVQYEVKTEISSLKSIF